MSFDLQLFGGGGGKSTGKLIGSIAFGAAAVAFQMFGTGVSAFARFAMGASLFSSVWTATHKADVDGGSLDITRFDREAERMSSTAQIPVVYGMRKITGNQTFHDTDSDANTLHKHVVLCEGGIEGITSVCANDLLIPTGTQSVGTVFTLQNTKYSDATVRLDGKHLYLHANGVNHDIYLCNKDDTSGSYWSYQVSISGLISYLNRLNEGWQAFPLATTNKYPGDLHGVVTTACYNSVVDFTSDTVTGGTTYTFHDCETPDNYETVGGYTDVAWLDMTFQVSDELNGNPSVDCVVKGRKVYDPRTGVTAYSTNPALCLRDFLLSSRYGLGKWFKEADLDEDSWKESADYCDESVTFTNSDGSKETAKRYELNIVIDQQQSALQWLQTLLANFCGYIVYSNGKLKLCIEKPTVTSYKFNDDNCSDLKIEPLNLTNTPNRYEVSLVDPLNNWATVKAICEDLADQKLRQHIVTKSVSLEGVTSQHQALRLARFYRDYNLVCPLQFSFTTGMQGMSLEPGDVVTVSYHGVFTDMPMRISEIKETNKGTFEISGRQYNETIYSDDLGGGVHWYNYSTTKTSLYPQKPTNVKATTKYRTYADGSTGYDVIVTYSLPAAYDVETGLVYYKLNHETGENIVFDEGVAADEAGYSSPWSYAGDSATSCTISGAKLGDTYRIKVITRNRGGYLSDDSDIVTVVVREKATVPAQPQNLSYDFTDDFTFSWSDVADTDAVYYEVVCGDILLARTKYTTATVKLTERKATVDVYAVNSQGKRSYPAEISYDVPKPVAPASITFTEIPIGVKITVSDFPLNCHEMHLKIEGNTLTLSNATYSYQGNAGIYDVSAAYVDLFGEGEWSQTYAMTVKPVFKAEWVADESISLAKVDSVVKDAVAKARQATTDIVELKKSDTDITATVANMRTSMASQINQQADRITSVVTNLGKAPADSGYSAITQLQDDVNLRVSKGDVINQINLTAEGTTIDGKYLHVTGTTKFDSGVIVNSMLAANAVTADKISAGAVTASKLSVDSLSAVSATLGSVTGGDITGSTFRNANNTFSIDSNGNIVGANITGSSLHLTTSDFTAAGVHVGNIQFASGTINHGDTIPLIGGYTADECFCWVEGLTGTAVPGSGGIIVGYAVIATCNADRVVNVMSICMWTRGASGEENGTNIAVGGTARYGILGVKKI